MVLPPLDFESSTSANSITPAYSDEIYYTITILKMQVVLIIYFFISDLLQIISFIIKTNDKDSPNTIAIP